MGKLTEGKQIALDQNSVGKEKKGSFQLKIALFILKELDMYNLRNMTVTLMCQVDPYHFIS